MWQTSWSNKAHKSCSQAEIEFPRISSKLVSAAFSSIHFPRPGSSVLRGPLPHWVIHRISLWGLRRPLIFLYKLRRWFLQVVLSVCLYLAVRNSRSEKVHKAQSKPFSENELKERIWKKWVEIGLEKIRTGFPLGSNACVLCLIKTEDT